MGISHLPATQHAVPCCAYARARVYVRACLCVCAVVVVACRGGGNTTTPQQLACVAGIVRKVGQAEACTVPSCHAHTWSWS